jgi:hypothetical protein
MPVGYEGIAYIEDTIFLCSGASAPRTRNRIESASGYGGRLSTPVAEIGIGAPRNYDWSTYDGSLNFEMNSKLFTDIIKVWLFARQETKQVKLRPRYGSYQQFDDCYWNSITFSASEGSVVNGSIGFVAIDRDDFDLKDEYIDNKEGYITCSDLSSSGDIPSLNDNNDNLNPIPFWKTRIEASGLIDPDTITIYGWTLTFSQDVVKFFKCEGNSSVQPPFRVGVGPMMANLQMEIMILNDEITTLPDELNNVTVHVGTSSIQIDDLEIDADSDDVQTGSALVPLTTTYNVYKLVA